jgi:hypothetical protein
MSARQPPSQLRSLALIAALFAVTLAIMQPLVHSVMLRIGGPEAGGGLWATICQPSADGEPSDRSNSPASKFHDCCFGLAHAPVLLGPSVASIFVDQVLRSDSVPSKHHHPTTGAIRDGPQQPRAPPLPKD